MIERTIPHFGRLVFDRDAIVRAALRAYLVDALEGLGRHNFPCTRWTGDLQRGALFNSPSSLNNEVVAWTETGVVGLAFCGYGPIEQLGLSVDAVTGGPDDVRGAVSGLPEELEPAFVRAVGMLGVGPEHGQVDAGVGFWLCGDRSGGSLFDDSEACGADRLAAWGLLRGDRLPHACGGNEIHFHPDEPAAAPFHAVIDAVTARALAGPTELTSAELATLLHLEYPEPDPKLVLLGQRMLQQVGITWPGSPEIPA